ncbi:hypothetical protein [Mycetocola spongiae]|uniref:hypothetical protein n=1 Tax=Mycetocola spongiae TaxID=2859226 RepID=UPI001CF299D3|nr:hypothetical protein [Mycetocola spongiae]UCR87920.1 hypothetical protein KXZ72_07775 [Mycetocola spongiae]
MRAAPPNQDETVFGRRAAPLRELAGLLIALALALIAVSRLGASPRGVLLYEDADSVLPALVAGSLRHGAAQDWALSPVLFGPELAVYLALSALGLGVGATLALNAVLNLLALYGAFRLVARVAGDRLPRAARIPAALAALAVAVLFILLETDASRDALEVVSLLATTTYYSATVIGTLLFCALAARTLTTPGRHGALAALGIIAVTCTASNPLFLAWAVAPVLAVMVLLLARRALTPLTVRRPVLVIAAGMLLGLALRIPLARFITADGSLYFRPAEALASAQYYGQLLAERAQDPGGALSLLALLALIGLNLIWSLRALREGWGAGAFLLTLGWLAPPALLLGFILLGTHAARYLAPLWFFPLLAVVLAPALLGRVRLPPRPRLLGAAAGILVLLAAGFSLPALVERVRTPHPDIGCVLDWAGAHGGTGAGEFWTVRAAKAYAEDPADFIQVGATWLPRPWLVNRSDYDGVEVSFLITPAWAAAPDIAGVHATRAAECGAYALWDLGATPIRFPAGTASR